VKSGSIDLEGRREEEEEKEVEEEEGRSCTFLKI
jgi:hypothetical protein